jgi:BirA family biotin operon repressor/biotin-[acetyl-CoA-carboxylase] ligase
VTDDLNPERLAELLRDVPLGRPIRPHSITGSTNSDALDWARQDAPHGALVIAEAQTKGRGRRGRSWDGGRGQSILASLILRTNLRADRLGLVGGAVAVALCRTLEGKDLAPATKWPNDVWIGGKKVAGVLPEAVWSGDRLEALVVGIGVNVNQEEAQLPPDARTPPTSLYLESGRAWDRGWLLRDFLAHLSQALLATQQDPQPLVREWMSREVALNRAVELHGDARTLRGTVTGIHPDGGLSLRQGDGTELKVGWGEVSLLPLTD